KAFVYNGKDKSDEGKPFLTLHPGDRYDLAARRVIHRAIEETKLTQKFIDGIFAEYNKEGSGGATVLVAQKGKVFVNSSYGIPPQRKYMPTTTVPNFKLGGLSDGLNAAIANSVVRSGKIKLDDALAEGSAMTLRQYLSGAGAPPGSDKQFIELLTKKGGIAFDKVATDRIMTPVGMHKTKVDATTGAWMSNVDELYRWELGMTSNRALMQDSLAVATSATNLNAFGWTVDSYKGTTRQSEFYSRDGKRNAFVRFPEKGAAVIILTNDDKADARAMANKIADKLLFDGQK
ncbi:MAG: hypothetical protein ABJB66_16645, partial [Gemmatimonadaceae bacterium]